MVCFTHDQMEEAYCSQRVKEHRGCSWGPCKTNIPGRYKQKQLLVDMDTDGPVQWLGIATKLQRYVSI